MSIPAVTTIITSVASDDTSYIDVYKLHGGIELMINTGRETRRIELSRESAKNLLQLINKYMEEK